MNRYSTEDLSFRNQLQAEKKYFVNTKDMLRSWDDKLKGVPQNKLLKHYGIAMQYWLEVPQDKLKLINKIVNSAQFKKDSALEIGWISGTDNRNHISKPEYNISGMLNEFYYLHGDLLRCILELDEEHKVGSIMMSNDELVYCANGMIAYWNMTITCPTLDEYVYHMRNYSLYNYYVAFMKLFSKNDKDFTTLGQILSILSAVYQDYEKLNLELSAEDNVRIGDYTKKLFTVPVIHAITFSENKEKILNILRLNNGSEGLKQYLASLLENKNSIEYAEENIKYLKEQALLEVKRLGGNPLMEEFVKLNF